MDHETAFGLIRQIPFFSPLDLLEKKRLASVCVDHFIRYTSGSVVVKEGSRGGSFFVLLKGKVKVTRSLYPDQVLARLEPGAVFGEMAISRLVSRSTNVIAESDVVVLEVVGDALDRLDCELREKIKNQVIETLSERVRKLNDALLYLAGQMES